mgnify:CR=1 FL=1
MCLICRFIAGMLNNWSSFSNINLFVTQPAINKSLTSILFQAELAAQAHQFPHLH